MHERILSIEARRPRLINGLLGLEGAVHEPIGADATCSTGFSSSANAGDGRNRRAIEMQAFPFNAIKKNCSFHSSTLLLAERTPSCKRYSLPRARSSSGRHEAAG